MLLALVIWYFMNSFRTPLPWSSCPTDSSKPELVEECHKSTPTNYFWYRYTLNISTDIGNSGPLQWWLVLCLAACWIIVFLCTIRGIETTGKAIYFTATFPFLILTLFLIYGLTLPGAVHGLIYFMTPNLTKIKNPRAWLDAATQIFSSLSLGFGGHIAYASYNPSRNDCERDAIMIAAVNSLTSLFASIPVFSILGFKATVAYEECLERNVKYITEVFRKENITVDSSAFWLSYLNGTDINKLPSLNLENCDRRYFLDQSVSGPGLAFIVFTEIVLKMPGSNTWAILFFLMLFSLGISSMFGFVESLLTPLSEFRIVSRYIRKEAVCGLVCFTSFLLGLIFTLRSGSYWLEMFDGFAGTMPLLVIAFFEVVGVIFVYGMKRFSADVEEMTGRPLKRYWKSTWQFFSPAIMFIIFLSYMVAEPPSTYKTWNPNYIHFPAKESKRYPIWAVVISEMLETVPCLMIPFGAIYQLCRIVLKKKKLQIIHPDTSTGST